MVDGGWWMVIGAIPLTAFHQIVHGGISKPF